MQINRCQCLPIYNLSVRRLRKSTLVQYVLPSQIPFCYKNQSHFRPQLTFACENARTFPASFQRSFGLCPYLDSLDEQVNEGNKRPNAHLKLRYQYPLTCLYPMLKTGNENLLTHYIIQLVCLQNSIYLLYIIL